MSKENLEILTRGAEEIIPEESFLKQIKSKEKRDFPNQRRDK